MVSNGSRKIPVRLCKWARLFPGSYNLFIWNDIEWMNNHFTTLCLCTIRCVIQNWTSLNDFNMISESDLDSFCPFVSYISNISKRNMNIISSQGKCIEIESISTMSHLIAFYTKVRTLLLFLFCIGVEKRKIRAKVISYIIFQYDLIFSKEAGSHHYLPTAKKIT